MKALPKILLALTAVAALTFAYPAAVQAVPTTYVYTGNPFTQVSGPYSTSDFVTVMVTLANPLAPNRSFTNATPTGFTLTDGVQTLTNLTALGFGFAFATGPTGMITLWQAHANNGSAEILTQTISGNVTDLGTINPSDGLGRNFGHAGTWAVVGVPDVGSSLALLSLSLTALGVAARQFKRAAA